LRWTSKGFVVHVLKRIGEHLAERAIARKSGSPNHFSLHGVALLTMPKRDIYHDTVIEALTTDGWTITHDPLALSYGGKDVYVDLGAAQPIGAQKGARRIAVEIKSFLSPSDVHDLELAIGQYALYNDILSEVEPDRSLYLAIPERVYKGIFSDPLGQLILARQQLQLIVFDDLRARIEKWIP
jgi:hypothetical protein